MGHMTELRVLELTRQAYLALATDADRLGAQLGRAILQRYVRAALDDAIPGAAATMAKVDAIKDAALDLGRWRL